MKNKIFIIVLVLVIVIVIFLFLLVNVVLSTDKNVDEQIQDNSDMIEEQFLDDTSDESDSDESDSEENNSSEDESDSEENNSSEDEIDVTSDEYVDDMLNNFHVKNDNYTDDNKDEKEFVPNYDTTQNDELEEHPDTVTQSNFDMVVAFFVTNRLDEYTQSLISSELLDKKSNFLNKQPYIRLKGISNFNSIKGDFNNKLVTIVTSENESYTFSFELDKNNLLSNVSYIE